MSQRRFFLLSRDQNGHPMYFLNSRLQFFAFIWYKQFTESRGVAAGRFLFKRFVCISRVRPASKFAENVEFSSRPGHGT
jgi:hypothetical protein